MPAATPSTAIVIPARYGSSRFPGKPLTQIAGKSMLQRVVEVARQAAQSYLNVEILVATEDTRILQHCEQIQIPCFMTAKQCLTGSDRVLAAVQQLATQPELVVNLQGDAPFTPPSSIAAIIQALIKHNEADVATPVEHLTWQALDALRTAKKDSPFSGTTAILNSRGQAIWFSKNIIPAIRHEQKLRQQALYSPVHRHIGLYGFKYAALEKFVTLPEGYYEKLEGLEQLRMLENGYTIQTVQVEVDHLPGMAGIDTPEDAKRAEALIATQGESSNV